MQVLVIGSRGLLGQDIVRAGQRKGWLMSLPNRHDLNIADQTSTDQYIQGKRFDWIINCAAYVAVDDAEVEQEQAYKLNSHGAFLAAVASIDSESRLLHFSTDYVFDGSQSTPYLETDETSPLGVYAKSKLDGERHVLATNPNAVIARTAWLYGAGRPNFPSKIYKAATEGKPLRLVSDRVGSPTYTHDLANAITTMIEAGVAGGIYNVVNEGQASWYDLCKKMLEYAGIDSRLEPAENTDYPTPAQRPIYSVLSSSKLRMSGIPLLPHWKDAVHRFVDEIRVRGIPT